MPGAQSASACGAFHTEVLQSTEREDISNPEAPASRSLTSEFGLPVAGASPRRKNQSEPTSTSPEKSGRTGTSPEQTGVEDTQLARGMSYGLPTLRFQRRSESSENSVQRHCETLDVVPSVGEPRRSVRRTEAPRFSEGRVHLNLLARRSQFVLALSQHHSLMRPLRESTKGRAGPWSAPCAR
jgi:hypothetical protein